MKNIIKYAFLSFIFVTRIYPVEPSQNQFHDNEHIVMIENKADLEGLLQKNIGPCLIYFYMNNCGWCSKMKPIIETLSQDSDFLHTITFYKVNGPQTQAAELVQKNLDKKIQGYPTIFFMKQGKLFDTQVGGTSQEKMMQKLRALLVAAE